MSFPLRLRPPPTSPLFPYTTLFRSFATKPRSPAALTRIAHSAAQKPGERRGPSESRRSLHVSFENSSLRKTDVARDAGSRRVGRSEEHTSELQSRGHLVCRLLLEKK